MVCGLDRGFEGTKECLGVNRPSKSLCHRFRQLASDSSPSSNFIAKIAFVSSVIGFSMAAFTWFFLSEIFKIPPLLQLSFQP